jgi:hypothetical protein
LGANGCLCVIDGRDQQNPFGFLIGAAVRASLQDSIVPAFVEATRRAYSLIEIGDEKPIDLGAFMSLERPTFGDHGRLALDLEYADSVAALFANAPLGLPPPEAHLPVTPSSGASASGLCDAGTSAEEICVEDICIDDLDFPFEPFASGPFRFARAHSPRAQDLWVGAPRAERINFERLGRFLGATQPPALHELNLLPHPFC